MEPNKISAQVIQHRRNLGLCFKCEEKYGFGYQCSLKGSSFMILDEDEECDIMNAMDDVKEEILAGTEMDVCLNALSDKLRRNTITLFGVIRNQPMRILIDTGSTHSYIHYQLAQTLGLKQKGTQDFVVTLADGRKATCKSRCQDVD